MASRITAVNKQEQEQHQVGNDDSDSNLSNHRLFLSGLKRSSLTKPRLLELIVALFEPYGKLADVAVKNKKCSKHAFVTFQDKGSAQKARVELSKNNDLFEDIQQAFKELSQKSEKHQQENFQEWHRKHNLLIKSNLIIQLHRSHLGRLEEFLKHHEDLKKSFRVVGSIAITPSKSASLIFLHAFNPVDFLRWIENVWYVRPVIQTIFRIDQPIRGSLETNVVKSIIKLIQQQTSTDPLTVRLQIFPPKSKEAILNAIALRQKEGSIPKNVVFAPTHPTHSVNVVQLDEGVGPDVQGGLFGIGYSVILSTPKPSVKFGITNISDGNNRGVSVGCCRAYAKLQEALERYKVGQPPRQGLIALDCGAAPGGWTQYLAQQLYAKLIYSVDPGCLDENVLSMPQVHHVPMTIQNALPKLVQELDVDVNKNSHLDNTIQIWVSDMCVKDTAQQVDWLLEAKRLGLVGPGTFFCLTLKVITGRSHQNFDRVVNGQLERLDGISNHVQKLHLFTNRPSERTIIGYF